MAADIALEDVFVGDGKIIPAEFFAEVGRNMPNINVKNRSPASGNHFDFGTVRDRVYFPKGAGPSPSGHHDGALAYMRRDIDDNAGVANTTNLQTDAGSPARWDGVHGEWGKKWFMHVLRNELDRMTDRGLSEFLIPTPATLHRAQGWGGEHTDELVGQFERPELAYLNESHQVGDSISVYDEPPRYLLSDRDDPNEPSLLFSGYTVGGNRNDGYSAISMEQSLGPYDLSLKYNPRSQKYLINQWVKRPGFQPDLAGAYGSSLVDDAIRRNPTGRLANYVSAVDAMTTSARGRRGGSGEVNEALQEFRVEGLSGTVHRYEAMNDLINYMANAPLPRGARNEFAVFGDPNPLLNGSRIYHPDRLTELPGRRYYEDNPIEDAPVPDDYSGVKGFYRHQIPRALRAIGAEASPSSEYGHDWLAVNLNRWKRHRDSQGWLAGSGRQPLLTKTAPKFDQALWAHPTFDNLSRQGARGRVSREAIVNAIPRGRDAAVERAVIMDALGKISGRRVDIDRLREWVEPRMPGVKVRLEDPQFQNHTGGFMYGSIRDAVYMPSNFRVSEPNAGHHNDALAHVRREMEFPASLENSPYALGLFGSWHKPTGPYTTQTANIQSVVGVRDPRITGRAAVGGAALVGDWPRHVLRNEFDRASLGEVRGDDGARYMLASGDTMADAQGWANSEDLKNHPEYDYLRARSGDIISDPESPDKGLFILNHSPDGLDSVRLDDAYTVPSALRLLGNYHNSDEVIRQAAQYNDRVTRRSLRPDIASGFPGAKWGGVAGRDSAFGVLRNRYLRHFSPTANRPYGHDPTHFALTEWLENQPDDVRRAAGRELIAGVDNIVEPLRLGDESTWRKHVPSGYWFDSAHIDRLAGVNELGAMGPRHKGIMAFYDDTLPRIARDIGAVFDEPIMLPNTHPNARKRAWNVVNLNEWRKMRGPQDWRAGIPTVR